MTDCEYVEEDAIPMSVKSELYRLSSLLNLEESEVQTERDCLHLIASAIRSIERIKSEKRFDQGKSSTSRGDTIGEEGTRQEKKLAAKAKTLEDDLRVSLKTFDDAATLKSKVLQAQGQLRKEREQRHVFEKFIESQNKKIMILITHVDKLMKALKRESGKTIKSLESNRLLEKEVFALNQKIEKQSKIIAVQNRYVSEIAEGSRILQDQLALMDERYLELRNRLESSRKQFSTHMARVNKESSELRVKYSMATHGKLLDTLPMPSQYDLNFAGGGTEGMMTGGAFRGSMDTAELLHRSGTGKGGRPRAKSARATLSSTHNSSSNNNNASSNTLNSLNNSFRPGSPGSPGGGHRNSTTGTGGGGEGWGYETAGATGYDGNSPFKDKAQRMFVNGITRNNKFTAALSSAEVEAKEKSIVKKITSKGNKADPDRWTGDKLQELVKGGSG